MKGDLGICHVVEKKGNKKMLSYTLHLCVLRKYYLLVVSVASGKQKRLLSV